MRIASIAFLMLAGASCRIAAGDDVASQTQRSPAAGNKAESQEDLVRRGKYLVHHVAMCIYCHTPRDQSGQIVDQQLLQGTPLPIKSPFANRDWAVDAPNIAGLPGGWNEQDMVRFLQTGKRPQGPAPEPPMPPYRMTERDATAVAAYLQSLD